MSAVRIDEMRRRRRWSGLIGLVGVAVVTACGTQTTGSGIGTGTDTRGTDPTGTSPLPAATGAVPPGWQVVTYRGVQVHVPETWPLHDGNHVPRCTGAFSSEPAAYIGPDLTYEAMSCPDMPGRDTPHDGLWIQPGDAPNATRTVTTESGQTVQVSDPALPGKQDVWLNGVHIEIGKGPDAAIAAHILNSVAAAPSGPDTAPPDACQLNPTPDNMPEPERLASQIVLDHGQITLDPPEPNDAPAISAEQAWSPPGSTGHRSPVKTYRLILARYSSPFPASPDGHGGYTPNDQHVLRWVMLATPNTAGCGDWSVWTVDTTTGARGGTSWSPGP